MVLGVHEPVVGDVLSGLPGPTRWSNLPPVDREHVLGVWNRMLGQLSSSVPVILHDCPPELLGDISAVGFARVGVPYRWVCGAEATTARKDAIGSAVGSGQGIGLKFADSGARTIQEIDEQSAHVARALSQVWSEWSFDPGTLAERVDVAVVDPVVGQHVSTPSELAARAAVARGVARNLHMG